MIKATGRDGETMRGSKRFRMFLRLTSIGLIAYVGSYVAMSAGGDWHASQTGKLRYGFGLSVTDVQRWQPAGARWEPFQDVAGKETSRGDIRGYLYSPLIRLDRRWVHRDHEIFATTQPTGN